MAANCIHRGAMTGHELLRPGQVNFSPVRCQTIVNPLVSALRVPTQLSFAVINPFMTQPGGHVMVRTDHKAIIRPDDTLAAMTGLENRHFSPGVQQHDCPVADVRDLP